MQHKKKNIVHMDQLDFSGFTQVPLGAYPQMLIRRSLGLEDTTPIEVEHVKLAVQNALQMPLRQSVGACFATAVAILIQQERKDLLLKDLYEILYHERLIRVVEGHECIIPLSPFWEGGYPLLKAWEYTMASLTDYDGRAYRYNFHTSLGLDTKDPEGIGKALLELFERNFLDAKEAYEKKFQDIRDHESALKSAQMRLNSAYRDEDIRRIQAEMQLENMRLDMLELDAHDIKKKLMSVQEGAKLFFEELDLQLLKDFYEVYDPQIRGQSAEMYQDTEAGFRLVWTKGLKNITQHVRLSDLETYLLAIKEFFLGFEQKMKVDHPELEKIIDSCARVVQQMVQSVPFRRRIEKKHPWAYPSGGSLENLLEGYFETKGPFQVETNKPQTPQDLFVFYLDLLKSLSSETIALFQNNPDKRLLALFPTHAFSLIPGSKKFREGWEDPGFSYTWIRDQVILPSKQILSENPGIFEQLEKAMGTNRAYEVFFNRFYESYPSVIFGDSNWENREKKPFYLAFMLDPKTEEIEVFRTIKKSGETILMKEWRHLFNEKEEFTVFTRPFQYGGPYTAPRLWQKI